MNKKILFRLGIAGAGLAVAVVWLVSVMTESFKFDLSLAVAIFSGVAGVSYILKGCLSKGNVVNKKFSILFGAALLIVCLISIAGAIALPGNYILPIIAIILSAAIFLGILFTGGKKWDQGDNKNVGYKNYRQRKAEEEKANQDDNRNNQ